MNKNMRSIKEIDINDTIKKAADEINAEMFKCFDINSVILFGSTARGDNDEESDIDLLVLTKNILTREQRHVITHIVFNINLHYGTNFSTTVVDIDSWESGLYSVLPIYNEVRKDGILLWSSDQK
jgi:uncharacterized protein